jgi:hypothetical protein
MTSLSPAFTLKRSNPGDLAAEDHWWPKAATSGTQKRSLDVEMRVPNVATNSATTAAPTGSSHPRLKKAMALQATPHGGDNLTVD